MSMIIAPRSCIGCSRSKRKCDKRTPACTRCKDKDATCSYPLSKPTSFVRLESQVEFRPNDFILNDGFVPGTMDLFSLSTITTPDSSVGCLPSEPCTAWFLSPDTWLVDHRQGPMPSTFPVTELKNFLQLFPKWFKTWVDTGSNIFIHKNLYSEHFPSTVQVAYTTLSAYINRTPANTDLILRITNERANDLIASIESQLGVEARSPPPIEQLAQVHALFVYQVIGVLDGDIRSRSHADARFPIFAYLLDRLIEHTYEVLPQSLLAWNLDDALLSSPTHTKPKNGNWKAWIVAESMRRTWLVAKGLQSAYEGLKQGYTGCPGGIMFTNGEGMWNAKSASAWEEICTGSDVFFMHRFDADRLFHEASPDKVDEFGKIMLEVTFGGERVQEWMSRHHANGELINSSIP